MKFFWGFLWMVDFMVIRAGLMQGDSMAVAFGLLGIVIATYYLALPTEN